MYMVGDSISHTAQVKDITASKDRALTTAALLGPCYRKLDAHIKDTMETGARSAERG